MLDRKEDYPIYLHTALRKACDSTITSLVWNLLYPLHGEVWHAYLDHTHAYLVKMESTAKKQKKEMTYAVWLKEASLKESDKFIHPDWVNATFTDSNSKNAAIALYCAFKLFSDSDWKGFAAFLEE